MLSENWLGDEQAKPKSRRKSKGAAHAPDEPINDEFDDMLDNASKMASRAASSKPRSAPRPTVEAAGGWSNDIDNADDNVDIAPAPPVIRRTTNRRAAEEIVATNIPTIPMDDVDGTDTVDMGPEVAVAPEFSVYQIATFKEIEKEFSHARTSQYIDSKIDIGILYHNLNLQEELDTEENKPWDWDKLFVEVRNAITNPLTE